MTFGVALLLLITLFVLRVPVAFSLFGVSLLYFYTTGVPLDVVAQRAIAASQSFPLLAIPLFILAGLLMNSTGMTRRLFRFAEALVGTIPGSLGHVVVAVGMVMAGTSGSAIADAAALTQVAVPEMEKAGYPRAFSAVITAFAATIGPIIPPSIMFIVYGWLANVSIGELFLAGAIPGLVVGLSLFVIIYFSARKHGYGHVSAGLSWDRIWQGFKGAVWALAMPIVILGGIAFGAFTPTEAGAVAVLYAGTVGGLIYRSLHWRNIKGIVLEAIVSSISIMFIVAAAYPFGWILTAEQVPQKLLETLMHVSSNPAVILLLINLVLLLLGMVMETTSIMIIVVPLLIPLVTALRISPVHFGVVLTVNLLLGTITPPFGVLMYTACGISEVSTIDFQRSAVVFYLSYIVALALITYWPAVSLWLPGLLH